MADQSRTVEEVLQEFAKRRIRGAIRDGRPFWWNHIAVRTISHRRDLSLEQVREIIAEVFSPEEAQAMGFPI